LHGIPDATIDEVRERVDIVDLVGRYLSLKPSGRNHFGLCPFHGEKTPSFSVNRDRQIWHCFGCQEGGNAFTFLMRHDNLTFPEAVRQLAREVGVEIPESGGAPRQETESLVLANEAAQEAYRAALAAPEAATARAYLERRGLAGAEAERFGIGLAPDAWDHVLGTLRRRGLGAEVGERAGLLARRQSGTGHYDRLRGRITFPIQDVRGRVVGFGGRALAPDQEPKYLNTPETPLFRKREAFFGFPMALEPMRRTGRAVVVEGYFDLIALHRAGVEETVATCGTALTEAHARNLRRRAREVVLLFDADAAGERAMARALEILLPEGLRVRAALLPAGDDPDSFLVREGAEALRRVVDSAEPALEHVIRSATARGCGTAWEKADAIGAVAPLLVRVTDPVERGELSRRLALSTQTELRHVELALRQAARGRSIAADPEWLVDAPSAASGPEQRHARAVARQLVRWPELADVLDAEALGDLLPAGRWRDLALQILALASDGVRLAPAALSDQLEGEARAALLALSIEDAPEPDRDSAARVLHDTLEHLRQRSRRKAAQDATDRIRREPASDMASWIALKQRQLEARRAALGLSNPPVPSPPSGRR